MAVSSRKHRTVKLLFLICLPIYLVVVGWYFFHLLVIQDVTYQLHQQVQPALLNQLQILHTTGRPSWSWDARWDGAIVGVMPPQQAAQLVASQPFTDCNAGCTGWHLVASAINHSVFTKATTVPTGLSVFRGGVAVSLPLTLLGQRLLSPLAAGAATSTDSQCTVRYRRAQPGSELRASDYLCVAPSTGMVLYLME